MCAVEALKRQLPRGVKNQVIERSFLSTFKFSGRDLVITIGPDGLVINTSKYLTDEPILAVNPDPARVDGILVPFGLPEVRDWIDRAMQGKANVKRVSMAKAELNDGQSLYAVNDLFVGVRSHVSAGIALSSMAGPRITAPAASLSPPAPARPAGCNPSSAARCASPRRWD